MIALFHKAFVPASNEEIVLTPGMEGIPLGWSVSPEGSQCGGSLWCAVRSGARPVTRTGHSPPCFPMSARHHRVAGCADPWRVRVSRARPGWTDRGPAVSTSLWHLLDLPFSGTWGLPRALGCGMSRRVLPLGRGRRVISSRCYSAVDWWFCFTWVFILNLGLVCKSFLFVREHVIGVSPAEL